MASWYTWQMGTQREASGESHVLDSSRINAVPYQQEAAGNHVLTGNIMQSAQYVPTTPHKFNEVVDGSPAQVVGLPQAPSPGGAQRSFRSLLQQNGTVTQTSYCGSPLLSNGKIISDPFILSGYHQMPPSQGGFSIQYKNNIYFSPEATARTAVTRPPTFTLAYPTQNPCQVIDDHTSKINAVGVTSAHLDSHATQSGSPINFGQSHASSSETSSFSFFKSLDHTSLRRENLMDVGEKTDSVPPAPITPEKLDRVERNPSTEVVILVDDSECRGSGSQKENFGQVGEGNLKVPSNQDTEQSSFSLMGVSLQQTEVQIQLGVVTQGIDLNKTPQQKPKKKKHRPKVIREGKPARKTKQTTPKPDGSEIHSVKRKYVRKKIEISSEIPSNAMETTTKAEGNATQTTKRKYVRKKGLNSSENPSTASEATVVHSNTNSKRSAKRSLNFDSEELHTQLRSHNCSLDFQRVEKSESNLNCSTNIPHNRGSLENLSLQSSEGTPELAHAVAPNVMFDLNHSVNELTDCCTGFQGDLIPTPQPLRREILKQNLKDLARKRVSLEFSRSDLNTSASQVRSLNNEKDTAGFSNIVMTDKPNLNHNDSDMHAQNVLHNKRMKEMCDKGLNGSTSSASSSMEFSIVRGGVQHDISATQLDGECIMTFDQTEKMAQISLMAPTQVTSFTSLISGIVSSSHIMNPRNQRLDGVLQTQVAGPSTESTSADIDPIDMLVQKLKYLTIKDGAEHGSEQLECHNALVLYNGQGMIVPVEGILDSSRRRRPRPKVDLDSETNRVWLLLMGKDGTTGAEEIDKDKERWWEEQRKVFQGRVESFIARMHQVQGDRRFSPWKGSVVDSVVGVFLTQNVSDVLSSSAFMSLAARFPSPSRRQNTEVDIATVCLPVESEEECMSHLEDGIELLEDKRIQQKPHQGCIYHERQQTEEAIEITEIPLQIGDKRDHINVKGPSFCDEHEQSLIELPEKGEGALTPVSESIALARSGDMRLLDSLFSSQSSVISSQNSLDSTVHSVYPNGLCSETGSEVNYFMSNDGQSFLEASSTSFMELLQMDGTSIFQELYHNESETFQTKENFGSTAHLTEKIENTTRESDFGHSATLKDVCASSDRNGCSISLELNDYARVSCDVTVSHIDYRPNSGCLEINNTGIVQKTLLMTSNSGGNAIDNSNHNLYSVVSGCSEEATTITVDKENIAVLHNHSSAADVHRYSYLLTSETDPFSRDNFNYSFKEEWPRSLQNQNNESASHSEMLHGAVLNQQSANSNKDLRTIAQSRPPNWRTHHVNDCTVNLPTGKNPNIEMSQAATDLSPQKTSENVAKINGGAEKSAKMKKGRSEKLQNSTFDWDSLRTKACNGGFKKERSSDRMDSVDWEAIRNADVKEISETIRERGMNNMLAERIKDFLDRLVKEHGSIDLEWLRDVPPEKAKDYLLSIRGLGLKSVECVRLLTLHHLAFPVDTNVGRICVRLGWVPLQPLPESLQLHLLELYPLLETIQKYLWPRLCTLDQRTLYELHYQLITFGKVFCTKSKPNCNACPMRAECKHFASAFASARLALPAPEEKGLVTSVNPTACQQCHDSIVSHMPPLQLEGNPIRMKPVSHICEPIIEEPASPEPECIESLERDIEDAFYEDPDDIPTIHLNIEEFSYNLQNVIQENNMQLEEYDMSKALVALMPNAASIPQPKLKNVNRLRTEHQVYELPDSHTLLEGLDRRESDDPCPYLLAIWSPGETADSIEPPRSSCDAQEIGKLCDNATCPSCNGIREAQAQKVRGTLLIPCRTAMRGSFPLNGTYFQVNEVFADHASSLKPIDVPRDWLWNLPRRTVYFGTSVPAIFRGLTTQEIQHCFWRGFVCVRGFDQKTRAPRPLIARLHFPVSKAVRNKKGPMIDE